MSQSSTSIPSSVCVDAVQTPKALESLKLFLIRRRIPLSAILFTGLGVADVLFGPKPHDVTNFRDPLTVLGVVFILGGLGIRSWAVGILRKDAELTTTGPYRLIRNPLYLGSFLMMFGFCALINIKNFWLVLVPIVILYSIKVHQEERMLAQNFPEQWPDYYARTPRFLPRLGRVDLQATWSVDRWLHSREHHALASVLVALVAIKIWQVI